MRPSRWVTAGFFYNVSVLLFMIPPFSLLLFGGYANIDNNLVHSKAPSLVFFSTTGRQIGSVRNFEYSNEALIGGSETILTK